MEQLEQNDTITLMTPESVPITLNLAGIGSRFIAFIIDISLIILIFLVVTFTGAAVASQVNSETVGTILLALYIVFIFCLLFGYFVLFEVKSDGQTPGKKAASVKVIRDDGQPVNFASASIRAIIFIFIDTLFIGLPAVISILASKRNQRVGDLAAGTLVIRSYKAKAGSTPLPPPPPPPPEALFGIDTWDVSQVDDHTIELVHDFLQRRGKLNADARQRLATSLATQIRAVTHASNASDNHERFLEQIYAAKQAR